MVEGSSWLLELQELPVPAWEVEGSPGAEPELQELPESLQPEELPVELPELEKLSVELDVSWLLRAGAAGLGASSRER